MSTPSKLALVTGASRGLGLAIAEALSERGFHLILSARDQGTLDRVVARLPNSTSVACDIRDPESVARLAAVVRKSKRLDVLINNAGIAGPVQPVESLDYEIWREVVETNLHGTFLVTQALLPLLGEGSVIVNNVSVAARTAFPGMSAYNSSKRGLLAFTETLREELRPRGIRVVALLPGATDTGIWKQFWPDAPRERMMSPKTIAEVVVGAVTLPASTNVDELVVTPSAGSL
ncbi:MAG: short-chain dehydrogenase [Acidobacteria bacterium]|nr:MAG: short-chain dehydrogenase [Acidobacteriota bacterium]